jgi:ubiquinone/menaquinone biosynthesis C-methylase UbiE
MERYWSRFSDDFDAKQAYVAGNDLIESVKAKLTDQKALGRLLEFGCGNGGYTRCILDEADSVIATDYSIEMVAKTKELFLRNNKVTVEQADCHKTGYDGNSFDTVLMANLIHIIDKQDTALREAKRVLKPRGSLIITSFTTEKMSLVDKLGLLFRFRRTFGPLPKNRIPFTTRTLLMLLQREGFSVSEATLLGNKTRSLFVKAIACD